MTTCRFRCPHDVLQTFTCGPSLGKLLMKIAAFATSTGMQNASLEKAMRRCTSGFHACIFCFSGCCHVLHAALLWCNVKLHGTLRLVRSAAAADLAAGNGGEAERIGSVTAAAETIAAAPSGRDTVMAGDSGRWRLDFEQPPAFGAAKRSTRPPTLGHRCSEQPLALGAAMLSFWINCSALSQHRLLLLVSNFWCHSHCLLTVLYIGP